MIALQSFGNISPNYFLHGFLGLMLKTTLCFLTFSEHIAGSLSTGKMSSLSREEGQKSSPLNHSNIYRLLLHSSNKYIKKRPTHLKKKPKKNSSLFLFSYPST